MALFWCISIPAAVLGWIVFGTAAKVWTLSLVFSLASLVLATFSLVIVFFVYPSDMNKLVLGDIAFFPSLAAFALALCGIWKRNPLRWSSLICALGVWLYWFLFNAGM